MVRNQRRLRTPNNKRNNRIVMRKIVTEITELENAHQWIRQYSPDHHLFKSANKILNKTFRKYKTVDVSLIRELIR